MKDQQQHTLALQTWFCFVLIYTNSCNVCVCVSMVTLTGSNELKVILQYAVIFISWYEINELKLIEINEFNNHKTE